MNVVGWNATTSAGKKNNQWDITLALLKKRVHQMLTPDVVSGNAAISACEKDNQ